LQELDTDVTVGLVSNTQCASFEELLQWILLAFELEYRSKSKVELYHTFTDFLVSEYKARRRVALIIDEAQHLGPDSLEQLRMLSNVNVDQHEILQLILVGQPNLWSLLRRPELEQFAQRVTVDFYLEPLDAEETKSYIHHRLSVAGGNPEIFGDRACELVWRNANGVPRLINVICETALVYAFAEEQPTVTAELVADVVRDKQIGLAPIQSSQGSGDKWSAEAKSESSTIEKLYGN
jgi:type II secretory pathway predicted ATPase ExeA